MKNAENRLIVTRHCKVRPKKLVSATGLKEPRVEGLHSIGDWQAHDDTPDCLDRW